MSVRITLAKSAGFCFGVDKAVSTVYRLLEEGCRVCTLGPIIHNPQVVADLAARGVITVDAPEQVPEGAVMVIRSHGVPASVYARAEELGIRVCDCTCPFVAKIHRIVREQSAAGATVLIAGDPAHPEVMGIRGHCSGPSFVFSSEEELEELLSACTKKPIERIVIVAQTTFLSEEWKKYKKFEKKYCTNLVFFDTICNATAIRQSEAEALSRQCDVMVIVGGRQSSNTRKLQDVCRANAPTVLIESAQELNGADLVGARSIGITAGASTPADIIKEVLSTMSEIINNEELQAQPAETVEETVAQVEEAAEETAQVAEEIVEETVQAAPAKDPDQMTDEELMEYSLESLNNNSRVRGIVTAVFPNEVQVEVVGRKQTGYIPADELSADPSVNPADLVKVGDELELLIMRTNDQEGTITLSKKRVDAQKGWDTVVAASESGAILEGTVTDVIKGGVLAVTDGVRVFIPASQATVTRMEDLSPLKGQTVRFRIIEVNTGRRRAVGSVRSVAREERKEREAAFWAQAEVGQKYTGVVKSLTSYGAFVDIGGVDGMIHISELSWSRVKHPSEVVNVGDTVEVYIRDLDTEKKKISLGYRKAEDNPWEIFKANYPIGSVVKAKIVGMTTFGAFAQIIPGIDGLIHISQIADHRIEKPQDVLKNGQEVTVKITNVDYDSKRVSLSIRALLDEAPAAEETAETAETAEETPAEPAEE